MSEPGPWRATTERCLSSTGSRDQLSTNDSSPVQHRGADGGGRQQVGAVRAQAALRRHLARTPVVELRQTRVVTWSLYIHACCYLGVAPPTPETRQPVVALDGLVTLVTLPRHVTLHLDTSQYIKPRVVSLLTQWWVIFWLVFMVLT